MQFRIVGVDFVARLSRGCRPLEATSIGSMYRIPLTAGGAICGCVWVNEDDRPGQEHCYKMFCAAAFLPPWQIPKQKFFSTISVQR